MNPWTRTILVAVAATIAAFLLFGLLVSFDYAVTRWYLPLVASLVTGSVVHMYRRRRVQATK